MTEYKIVIEYMEWTQYEVRINSEGFAEAGNIYDHEEKEPTYLVYEIIRGENGEVEEKNIEAEFEYYDEAVAYAKEKEQ